MAEKRGKTKAAKKDAKQSREQKAGIIVATGKRKRAVARARIRPGKGIVKINMVPLELVRPEMLRLKIQEPLMLLGEGSWKNLDIHVSVKGGGPASQADAARQAISRGMAEAAGGEARDMFLQYDRNLLVYDPRRAEVHKPPHSSWGARRYKQRSKR
jgi:small subunit ribosomal protein S9